MILLIYAVLLFAAFRFTRGRPEKVRSGVIVGYNFLFVLITQFVIRLLSNGESLFGAVGNSLYNTVMDLTFNGDIDWSDKMTQSMQAQMWLITFFAAVFTVQSVIVTFLGRNFAQFKHKLKLRKAAEQYIIAGGAEDAELLVSDLLEKLDGPCIVCIPSGQLEKDSDLYMTCRVEKPSYLQDLDGDTLYHIVLLPEQKFANLETLCAVNERADGRRIYLTAFIDNDVIRFHDIHADNIDTCLVSKEQIIVRKYFDECSPIDILTETGSFADKGGLPYLAEPFSLCVIGFGSIGKEFLLYSYENCAFPAADGVKSFSALVIDGSPCSRKEEFYTEAPYFEQSDEIGFLYADYCSDRFFEAIKERAREWKQILVSTEDSRTNIEIAIRLRMYYNRLGIYDRCPQIVVIMNDDYSGAEQLLKDHPDIKIINVSREVFNYETLIGRGADEDAKKVNEQYGKIAGKDMSWNKLGTFTAASNRALSFDAGIKKKLYRLCGTPKEQSIEFLSRYEHSRWNAFHYARGWRHMPVSDLTESERSSFKTKHLAEKRHICLVPWEELDSLPQKEPGIMKKYDRENVIIALSEELK